MTTPRDPDRSVRGGSSPRAGADGDEPGGEERWTPEDRYVVERRPRGAQREEYDDWQPQARRRRSMWASAALAGLLGAVLVALIAAAAVLPGLLSPSPSAAASASPSGSLAAASPSATATPSPSPTPAASLTPVPSVVEVEVQPGDSLNSIADEFNTHPRSIAFWNRDRYPTLDPQSPDYEPDRIQVGWTLVVYPNQTFPEPSTTPAPSGASSPAASGSVSP